MRNSGQQKKKSHSLKLIDVDPATINKNQLNSSSSKMQYSIPKQQRWKEQRTDSSHFYDIPDTKSKRCASFGYGKKMEFGNSAFVVPSVGKYYFKSEFTKDNKKGITISAGREVIKNNSVFGSARNPNPGPGKYDLEQKQMKQHSKGYTLSGRSPDLGDKWIKSVPGPGNYNTIELLDKNLKSVNSKFPNVHSGKFTKGLRKSDFEQKTVKVPGPGQYDRSKQTEKTKFPNKGGFKFSNSERQGIVEKKKNVPGPGSYQYFSEFIH